MEFKILNFTKKEGIIRNEITGERLTITDYWQYYITGIEKIVNEKDFILTDRYENERAEVLAYNFYENESVSDVLVLINNDNYLWDSPSDYDLIWDIVDNKMNYLRALNKANFNEQEKNYWREKIQDKAEEARNIQSSIVIPNRSSLQKVIRTINQYLEEREVK